MIETINEIEFQRYCYDLYEEKVLTYLPLRNKTI